MNFNKIIIFSVLLIMICSISVVSASDSSLNDHDTINDNIDNSNLYGAISSSDFESQKLEHYSDSKLDSSSNLNSTSNLKSDSKLDSSSNLNSTSNLKSDSKLDSSSNLNSTSNLKSDSKLDSSSNLNSTSNLKSDSKLDSDIESNYSPLKNIDSNTLSKDIQGPNLDTGFKDFKINLNEANTIYVNNSFTGSIENGTIENPYKTINLAFKSLSSAYDKNNVYIAKGFYNVTSFISVSRSINIIGESALNTILSGRNSSNIFIIKGESVTVNIFNLTFSNGYDYYGGSIFINHSAVNIVNSIFKDNTGVDYSSYYTNYSGMGGAIYSQSAILNIYNTKFCNNLAKGSEDVYGGAIYNYLGDLNIYNSKFINNTVNGKYGSGGAIYNLGGFLTLINSSLLNNTINSNYSLGGAITNWCGRNIFIINSTIRGNEINGIYSIASSIANKAIYLSVENTVIANNSANGLSFENETIYIMEGNSNFSNLTIENNTFNGTVENMLLCIEEQAANSDAFDENDLNELLSELNMDSLPSSYDLREENLITSIKDQGSSGSCWAFAALSSLESYLLKYENQSYNFSENNFKNIMNAYSLTGSDWEDGGNHLMGLAYLLRWSGPVDEELDPFSDYSTRSPNNLTVSKHVQDVLYIPLRLSFTDNDQIKMALLKYGALYTTIYSSSYMNYHTNYYTQRSELSNHAITLVGWDDNYSASNFGTNSPPPGDGAFIIKNSWGDSYGDDGYWYISYYDNGFATYGLDTISAYAFTNVENLTAYKSVYQYDILGNTYESLGYNSNTAWLANQFTAISDEPLSAFGLYTFGSSEYLVNITVNGISKYVCEGSIKGAGYHTIKLNEYIKLQEGDLFRIIVRLTTPDSKFPIAIESQRTGYSSKASASLSQSFVSPDGENWYDIAKTTELIKFYESAFGDHELIKTNVCLKAYTSYAGNLILNTSAASSLFLKGDEIEVIYNLSNLGDFVGEINISLALDDNVKINSVVSVSKGYFDISSATWFIDSLDSNESAFLKIKLLMGDSKETVDNYAVLSTSDYNLGHSGYLYDLDEDDEIKEANVLRFYYSGLSKFIEIDNITTFARSNEPVNITLVDVLGRPIANKIIFISENSGKLINSIDKQQSDENENLINGQSISLTTDENGTARFYLNFLEGNYSFLIRFNGDDEFEASDLTFNLTVNRIASSFNEDDLNSLSILSLSDEKIPFYLIDQFGNYITNKSIILENNNLNETNYLSIDENGNSAFSFNLTKGTYHYTLRFDGDEIYLPASFNFTVNVIKRSAPIILLGENIINETENFTICLIDNQFNVLSNRSINLIFEPNSPSGDNENILYYDELSDENGLIIISNLTYGNYKVSGLFQNDKEYEDSSFSDFNLIVLGKENSNETETPGSNETGNQSLEKEIFIETGDFTKYFGDASPYTINLTEGELVTFEINNITVDVIANEDNKASINLDLNPGTYNITIHYNNTSYLNTIEIKETILSEDIKVDSYRDDYNFSISFLDSFGNPLANHTVDIDVNGISKQYATGKNGTLIIPFENMTANQTIIINNPLSKEKRTNTITVPDYIPRTKTRIIFSDMNTTAVAKADGRIGEYFVVYLKDENNKVLSGKNIKVGFNGKVYDRTTDENGSARLQINLGYQGVYTFAIAFLGDDDYSGDFEVAKITVNKQSPILSSSIMSFKADAKTKTISASLKTAHGNPIPSKKIGFTINGKTYAVKTNSNGIATVNVSLNKKGTYSFTVAFAGDDTFTSVSKKLKLILK